MLKVDISCQKSRDIDWNSLSLIDIYYFVRLLYSMSHSMWEGDELWVCEIFGVYSNILFLLVSINALGDHPIFPNQTLTHNHNTHPIKKKIITIVPQTLLFFEIKIIEWVIFSPSLKVLTSNSTLSSLTQPRLKD